MRPREKIGVLWWATAEGAWQPSQSDAQAREVQQLEHQEGIGRKEGALRHLLLSPGGGRGAPQHAGLLEKGAGPRAGTWVWKGRARQSCSAGRVAGVDVLPHAFGQGRE